MTVAPLITPSGQLLYNRICKVTIAPPLPTGFKAKTQSAIVIEQLRVRFRLKKTLRKEPNTGEVVVFNLNSDTRSQLEGKGARLWLEAGYAGYTKQLFVGDVRFIDHRHEGAEWLSCFELGDGERAYAHGRVSASFKAGTSKADVVKELAKQCGWDAGNVSQIYVDIQNEQYANGYTYHGPAWRAFEDVLRPLNLTFSIQNGALQILPLSGYVPGVAIQLDSDHGLLSVHMGSGCHKASAKGKQKKPRMLKIKSLLMPDLSPGTRIDLRSQAHTGIFVAQSVEFEGDTHDREWTCTTEATPA